MQTDSESANEVITLNDWSTIIHQYAKDKGWWDEGTDRGFGTLIALLHTEISEAYEEYRDGHSYTETYYNPLHPSKPEGIPSELADVFIRLFDMCGYYGIDIEAAIAEKHQYNLTRPYRHGGKVS